MPELITQAELARRLGITRQAVGELVAGGKIALTPDRKIDYELALHAIAQRVHPGGKSTQAVAGRVVGAYLPSADDGRSGASSPDFQRARAQREEAEAAIAELKLAEMRGELLRADQVEAGIARRVAATREALMNLPPRITPLLANTSDAAAIQALLDTEIRQALGQLAGTLEAVAAPVDDPEVR